MGTIVCIYKVFSLTYFGLNTEKAESDMWRGDAYADQHLHSPANHTPRIKIIAAIRNCLKLNHKLKYITLFGGCIILLNIGFGSIMLKLTRSALLTMIFKRVYPITPSSTDL